MPISTMSRTGRDKLRADRTMDLLVVVHGVAVELERWRLGYELLAGLR